MLKFLNLFLFIFLFFSCENKSSKLTVSVVVDTLPAILIAGLGDMNRENIQNSVAKKYGFRFLRVGGCVVSKTLSDSMSMHNQELYKKLEKMHGKNFRSRLYEKINLLSSLQYRVEYILNNDSGIIRKNEGLGKEPYAMFYEIDPEIKNSILNIHAYDWADVMEVFIKKFTTLFLLIVLPTGALDKHV